MIKHLLPAIMLTVLMTALTGLAYPLAMTGLAGIALPLSSQWQPDRARRQDHRI